MFWQKKAESPLDAMIARSVQELVDTGLHNEEADKIMDRLERLHKLKSKEDNSRVDPNTVAMIVANLVGIGMIIKHEHVNVITSKAMGFVVKPKS